MTNDIDIESFRLPEGWEPPDRNPEIVPPDVRSDVRCFHCGAVVGRPCSSWFFDPPVVHRVRRLRFERLGGVQ